MDSLADLNTRTTLVPYDDQRGAALQLDREFGTNQSVSVNEGDSFSSPVGLEIVNIINPEAVDCYFVIDLTSLPNQGAGITVDWGGSLPGGMTATNPSTGIWRVGRIDDVSDWAAVRSPTIVLNSVLAGVYTYTATIFSNVYSRSWTVTMNIADLAMLTNATGDFTFTPGQTQTIVGAPQVTDQATGHNYEVIIYPSDGVIVESMSSTGSGGSSSFNSTLKRLTITGTLAQVNERLNNISVRYSSAVSRDFVMTYAATNLTSAEADTKTQVFKTTDATRLLNTRGFGYYVEDTLSNITQGPLVEDPTSATLVVSPETGYASAVKTMSSTGTGGTSVWDANAKTLTISGTKAQINSHIDNILLTPSVDYASTFLLKYNLSGTGFQQVSKLQEVRLQTPFDGEVTNMSIGREYIANNENQLFLTDVPYISDFDVDPNNIYSITFTTTIGKFKMAGVLNVASTITFQGTRANCNAAMASLIFYPNKGYAQNGSFTYTQQKNNVTQVTIETMLTGLPGAYTTKTVDFTTSGNYVLTYADLNYASYFDVLVVGSGGPGGHKGGGGGGGAVYERIDSNGDELAVLRNSGATYLNAVVYPGGSPAVVGPISNTVLSEYAYEGDVGFGAFLYPKRADNSIPSVYTTPRVRYLAGGGQPGRNRYTVSGVEPSATYSYNMSGGNGGVFYSSAFTGGGGQRIGSSSSPVDTLVLEQGGGGAGGAKTSDNSSDLDDIAGLPGFGPVNENAGVPGDGKFSEIKQRYYGGGGAGYSRFPGFGGQGGGGDTGQPGEANSGGGGGGAAGGGSQGGSGFIAVRFRA